MKKFIFIFAAAMFAACSQTPSTGNFGETITEEGASSVESFLTSMGENKEFNGKISGTVQKVCQSEGCWYTLEMPNGESMRVITKDHAFKLPKDASGKTAIAKGTARVNTTSVERLKHLAEDEGKSKEEIDAITEPEVEIEFEASGVIIK